MAFAAGAPAPERQRSPPIGLTLNNLSSNNPFRNRTTSPSPLNSPFTESPSKPRPTSTNPFLDNSEATALAPARSHDAKATDPAALPDDIFSELSLLDKSATNGASRPRNGPPTRPTPPPPYRPAGLEERRAPPRPPRGPDSPVRREFRHPPPPQQQQQHHRRASESSMMDKERRPRIERDGAERPPRTESEERRRNERRKEREERHRREKEKVRNGERSGKSDKRSRKSQGLDIIDKLDLTGIYGEGLFHHDGPFDACNPHRNAKRDRRAPMQAFPEGSANMALGGAGPLNSGIDLDRFHGRGVEGFSEYAATRKTNTNIIDPLQRTEPVHGEETFGLGTSTFLEGAPASKSALQRRDSEDPAVSGFGGSGGGGGGGLSRKKSLAQRLRGMSASRHNGPGDLRSPDARYQAGSGDLESPPPAQPQIKAISAGGLTRAKFSKENEINPFENDYEAAFDKKSRQIKISEQERPSNGRPRTPASPKGMGLTRSKTSDAGLPTRGMGSSGDDERPANGGGFLSRMKSLKGGPRRARNDG